MPCPRVTAAIGRRGATSGTCPKSNGLPISATLPTGSSVLQAECAVGELDLAVVDEVDVVAAQQQVLGERAAAPQVEAERRRGERRDEQDGPGGLARRGLLHRQVAVEVAQPTV